MKQGVVKEYDTSKGFGFVISDEGEDYFVHVSGLREHLKAKGLLPGQRVSFDIDFGMRGDKAINVRLD